jgi:hypothetical protein
VTLNIQQDWAFATAPTSPGEKLNTIEEKPNTQGVISQKNIEEL